MLERRATAWKNLAIGAGAVLAGAGRRALAIWGYKLAVRDVLGVPVMQAMDGPMRIAPDDPGGEIADQPGPGGQ